ncbi:MAG: ATP-binding cassette domain-containing protein, partial [Gammaproteobacteria bacterium]
MQTQRAEPGWNVSRHEVAARDPVLQLQALAFDSEGGRRYRNIALQLCSGSLGWIFGGRPEDRSQFIRVVCGLQPPHAGEMRWKGANLLHAPRLMAGELVYLDRRNAVKPMLTPREHLQFHLRLRACCPRSDIDSALEQLQLHGSADVACGKLSASAKRRVAIARLLVTRATILVLDDPMLDLEPH